MMRVMRTPREAAVFVVRRGQLLLLQRAGKGYWHVVAGVVEDGETESEAAIRELLEETGLPAGLSLIDLELRQTHPVGDMRDHYPRGVVDISVANFAIEAPPDWEPVLNEEHESYRWCSLDEAFSALHWALAREALGEVARRSREGSLLRQ